MTSSRPLRRIVSIDVTSRNSTYMMSVRDARDAPVVVNVNGAELELNNSSCLCTIWQRKCIRGWRIGGGRCYAERDELRCAVSM